MRKIKNLEKEHQYLEPIKEVFCSYFFKNLLICQGQELAL